MVPDEITEAMTALRARRPDLPIDLRWHPSVTSTMDVALEHAARSGHHGLVIGADEQTAGRGRRGNTWHSPPGAGLYVSMIVRPVVTSAASLPLLTLAAGVGVRKGIRNASGLAPDLKWPNDLMIGRRKLGGILAEGIEIGTPEQAVVIGIGINVRPAAYPSDVEARATSLEGELGRAVDRGVLLADILLGLYDAVAIVGRDPGGILQAWRAASPSATGTRVEWDMKHGTTAGIDNAGALLVKTPDGLERIISGELNWKI